MQSKFLQTALFYVCWLSQRQNQFAFLAFLADFNFILPLTFWNYDISIKKGKKGTYVSTDSRLLVVRNSLQRNTCILLFTFLSVYRNERYWILNCIKCFSLVASTRFAVKINQKVQNNWQRFFNLTACSRRPFALSETTGVLVTPSVWTDGTAVTQISSCLSLVTIGLMVSSLT